MDGLAEVTIYTLNLFGKTITINPIPIVMTWIISALILVVALIAKVNLKLVPGPLQSFFEIIYDFLKEITLGTLGDEDGKRHLPFIVALFIFILTANWIGIIPNLFQIFGGFIAFLFSFFDPLISLNFTSLLNIGLNVSESHWLHPLISIRGLEEPTRSINMDLALGLLVFVAVQAYGIRNKGFIGFLRNFFDDPFPMKGWVACFFFINPFFYLNLISAVANVVSHSFRLFGNIFGGGMIIVIVSTLLKYFLVPVGLFAFFGIFAGLVQAFVFTMLAVTYIQQQQ